MIDLTVSGPKSRGLLKKERVGGALIYGPPGTGKTHLARVLAKESNSVMLHVSTAEIEGTYVGDAEKFIRALFNLGRMLSPCVIFMDEADALFGARKEDSRGYERSRMAQLLKESDGLLRSKEKAPFLLLATNHPDQLDQAVLRRVPGRIYMGPPSEDARKNVFRIILRDEDLDTDLDFSLLAAKTRRFSGSDIKTLCVQAALLCESQPDLTMSAPDEPRPVLKMTHFEEALKLCGPTISSVIMGAMENFARDFDPSAFESMRRFRDTLPASVKVTTPTSSKRKYTETETSKVPKKQVRLAEPVLQNDVVAQKTSPTSTSGYQPLDKARSGIRVLEIKTCDPLHEKIECTLHSVSLEDTVSFTALSYVWVTRLKRKKLS